MEFRRYGGAFSGGDGGTNIKVTAVGVYLLGACCLLAVLFHMPGLVILGFGFLFGFNVVGMFATGGATSGLREERRRLHLDSAERHYKSGDFNSMRESLRRAKIYGDIPNELIGKYTQAQRIERSC